MIADTCSVAFIYDYGGNVKKSDYAVKLFSYNESLQSQLNIVHIKSISNKVNIT